MCLGLKIKVLYRTFRCTCALKANNLFQTLRAMQGSLMADRHADWSSATFSGNVTYEFSEVCSHSN